MGILEQAKTIDEIPAWIKFCLYGPPGVGKTYLAATAPKPFFLDLERSSETIRTMPAEFRTAKILAPKSMKDIFEVTKEFPKSEYETLIIDTGTRLQFFQLHEEMKAVAARHSHRNVYLPLFQEFRISSETLDDLFVQLQNMEKHVVIICHVAEDFEGQEAERKLVRIRPDLTPAVAKKLNGLLNVTGYLDYKAGIGSSPAKRILTVNPSGKITAKNRLGIQETSIENPQLKTLFTGAYK